MPLLPGTRVGLYEIVAFIGAGGMGEVYRATDTRLNRQVAIKFLSATLADAEARRRFQREAQVASSLSHPHILTVYDAGELDDRQYLVTELIDGGTLSDWARATPRSYHDIADLLSGVADGLANGARASPTCETGTPSNRDAALPVEGVTPDVLLVFPRIRAPVRCGSTHWKLAFALICGSACART